MAKRGFRSPSDAIEGTAGKGYFRRTEWVGTIYQSGRPYTSIGPVETKAEAQAVYRRFLNGLSPESKKGYRASFKKRKALFHNPATITGWVKAKAVKIVRNKAGKAVSVKIKT